MTGILEIIFDDLGYGDFGCYGSVVQTPNIDAIATAGRRFTRMVVMPACTPTRACLLTGLWPQYFGIHAVDNAGVGNRHWLPPHTVTLSRRLQTLGWKTGHFGKTHWGAPPQTIHPARFGWNKFFGVMHGVPNAQIPGYVKQVDSYFHDAEVTDPLLPVTTVPYVETGLADDAIVAQAKSWILSRIAAEENWYAQVWLFIPHDPQDVDLDENSLYPDPTWTERERYYNGSISHADTLIGDLVDAIDAAGAAASTYIAIGSENGPEPHLPALPHAAGSAGPFSGNKRSLYMGGIAVPWVMRGPGITAGSTDDRFRGAEDWVPTCLTIAGYDMGKIIGGLPGHDMLSTPPDRYLFRCYQGLKLTSGVTPPQAPNEWTCIKADSEGRWKLYRVNANGSGDKLFDLISDIGETTDVAGANPAILAELQGELNTWDATWAEYVSSNHAFDPEEAETEFEAVSQRTEADVPNVVIRCVDTNDRTAVVALIDKALGLPRTASCAHGFTGTSLGASYGAVQLTHPSQLEFPSLRVGAEFKRWSQDATILSRLDENEQEQLSDLCFDAAAPSVP